MKTTEEKEKSEYTHVIKYTGLFGGVQGITLLASLVRNKLVAVLLGPAGVGLISIYNTLITLLNNATNLGISFSAVRNVSQLSLEEDAHKLEQYVSVVRSWSILTAVTGTLACFALSSLISFWTFGNYDYTLPVMLLSPMVGLLAISGGELAILKGIRKLKEVALISVFTAVSTLFISVPLYYFIGMKGIIPSLLLGTAAVTFITLKYSFRYFPFRLPSCFKKELGEGISMVKLGVSFIAAGILGSGVEYVVRAYMLKTTGMMDVVGLYNAAYAVTVTYAGMIFVAMDTDYFPRLAAVNKNGREMNRLVNQQIEVALILVSPLLVIFLIFLPVILPLLYSSKFIPVVGMAECAVLGMLVRAVALPMAYISLAKGNSVFYLFQELVYDVLFIVLVILGFSKYGLTGSGVAISLTGAVHLIILYTCLRIKYKFRISRNVFVILALVLPWGVISFILTFMERGWVYWTGGIFCVILSTSVSLYLLQKKTTLLKSLIQKLKRK